MHYNNEIVRIRLKNGLFNGYQNQVGFYIWDNGDIYFGEFSDNMFNGQGIIIRRDQIRILSKFRNGKMDGPVQVLIRNTEKVKINYQNGQINEQEIVDKHFDE